METVCELCGRKLQAIQWGIVICASCVPNRRLIFNRVLIGDQIMTKPVWDDPRVMYQSARKFWYDYRKRTKNATELITAMNDVLRDNALRFRAEIKATQKTG